MLSDDQRDRTDLNYRQLSKEKDAISRQATPDPKEKGKESAGSTSKSCHTQVKKMR